MIPAVKVLNGDGGGGNLRGGWGRRGRGGARRELLATDPQNEYLLIISNPPPDNRPQQFPVEHQLGRPKQRPGGTVHAGDGGDEGEGPF